MDETDKFWARALDELKRGFEKGYLSDPHLYVCPQCGDRVPKCQCGFCKGREEWNPTQEKCDCGESPACQKCHGVGHYWRKDVHGDT